MAAATPLQLAWELSQWLGRLQRWHKTQPLPSGIWRALVHGAWCHCVDEIHKHHRITGLGRDLGRSKPHGSPRKDPTGACPGRFGIFPEMETPQHGEPSPALSPAPPGPLELSPGATHSLSMRRPPGVLSPAREKVVTRPENAPLGGLPAPALEQRLGVG